MTLTEFKIVALPYPDSDLTAEFVEYGTDENDARKEFERKYPLYRVKEITEV